MEHIHIASIWSTSIHDTVEEEGAGYQEIMTE